MNGVADVHQLIGYAQIVLYILSASREHILERDVTILVNLLMEFLRGWLLVPFSSSPSNSSREGCC